MNSEFRRPNKINSSSSILLTLVLLILVFMLSNFTSTSGRVETFSEGSRSPLVQYGESIFLRENCLECHTLRDENATPSRSSLDGYGGKRSAYWIYSQLIYPSSVGYRNHPTFQLLTQKTINESELQEIFKRNEIHSESEKDLARNELAAQLDSITSYIIEKQELSHDIPVLPERTEMVALIAFLQQIPSTPEREEKNRIQEEFRMEQLKLWDEYLTNSDSIIAASSIDPSNVDQGREVFEVQCITCHGDKAQGYIGINLTDNYWIYGNSYSEIAQVIAEGTENHKMPEHQSKMNPSDVTKLVLYLKSIEGTNVDGSAPKGILR